MVDALTITDEERTIVVGVLTLTTGSIVVTVVVSADLEGLVSSHEQAAGAELPVPQQLHVPRPALLPFAWLSRRVVARQLRPPSRNIIAYKIIFI